MTAVPTAASTGFLTAYKDSFIALPAPVLRAAEDFVAAARGVADPRLGALKMFAALNLIYWQLEAFATDENPEPLFIVALERARTLLEAGARSGGETGGRAAQKIDIGALYDSVHSVMTDDIYFDQSFKLLGERLERNAVRPEDLFKGRVILDAGCGNGRYTQAFAKYGAKRVIGIDLGPDALALARAKAAAVPWGSVLEYKLGSTLDIPLADRSVDFIWSNSVVHLTGDHRRCLSEFARVLQRDGVLFVYVDGLWGLAGLLRLALLKVCEDVPQALFQHYCTLLGIDSGRVSWLVACVYGPYQPVSKSTFETMLRESGFTDLRQLTRGTAIDEIEQISAGRPFAQLKYGEAQLKYLARRAG